ncbi:MAG: mycothiol synthase [Acidimicrobiia bacterium]|nr:mycothiol synthase [Acidimicrobiia bacterium]
MRYHVSSHLDPNERASVNRLLAEVERIDRRPALSDHLRLDLRGGGDDGFIAVVAHNTSGNDSGDDRTGESAAVVAYAQASPANDVLVVEMALGSAARGDSSAIGTSLIEQLVEAYADRGGGPLNWWIHGNASLREVAERLGFAETRRLFQMRMALPAEREVSVATRSFVVGQDEAEWVRVNNRAFAGHGEQGGWTTSTLRLRESEDWFDPGGFRVHERDGRMAAFCWTKVHVPTAYEPDHIGEIYVIAVDPDFHGLGLGSQLTLAGLDHLARIGITTAILYVDAANSTAVSMYERLGYEIHATSTAHHLEIPTEPPPAADASSEMTP